MRQRRPCETKLEVVESVLFLISLVLMAFGTLCMLLAPWYPSWLPTWKIDLVLPAISGTTGLVLHVINNFLEFERNERSK